MAAHLDRPVRPGAEEPPPGRRVGVGPLRPADASCPRGCSRWTLPGRRSRLTHPPARAGPSRSRRRPFRPSWARRAPAGRASPRPPHRASAVGGVPPALSAASRRGGRKNVGARCSKRRRSWVGREGVGHVRRRRRQCGLAGACPGRRRWGAGRAAPEAADLGQPGCHPRALGRLNEATGPGARLPRQRAGAVSVRPGVRGGASARRPASQAGG
jgi:hypothetical protein